MNNAEIILTKNRVSGKIKLLLEDLLLCQIQAGHNNLIANSSALFSIAPKISKGDNYQGLPYFILDFPRIFKKENICAIRILFWWGNFFSITLHISGIHKKKNISAIIDAFEELAGRNFFIGTDTDQWIHAIDDRAYKPVSSLTSQQFAEYCRQYDHLKIAAKWPLSCIPVIKEELLKNWRFLSGLIVH